VKKKTVFFHTPEFFPPLDFFWGLLNSDLWVVLDHVTFTSRSRQSRCRIKSENGVSLLAMGVVRPCNKPIHKTLIDNMQPWRRLFLKYIERFYKETPYFGLFYPDLVGFIESPTVLLETFTLNTCLWAAEQMGKQVEFIRTSEEYTKYPVSKIMPIVLQKVGGQLFNQPFIHPTYPQHYDPFERDLSILDALFCVGPENTALMLQAKKSLLLASS
jgi:hypothetical protein